METKEILEEIQGGIIIVDLEGSILFANKYACELVKGKKEEIKKHKITDFYKNPEQRKEFLAKLKKEGRVNDFELAIKTLKGEEKAVLANAMLIKFENKDASLTSFTDITQRKKLESELNASKNFIEAVVNSVEESVMVIDREKRIVEVNQQWLNVVGKSREEVIGRNCFEVIHHFKEPCPFCIASEVFETGNSVKIAREAKLPGKSMYIEISAYPLKENGKITKAVEVVRDITEYKEAQKKLEKAVEEKTSFLSSVINSITDAIVVVDRNYKILEINKAALSFLGKKKSEVLDKQCFVAFFRKEKPCEWCQCMEAFEKGKHAYGRVELKDEKGNITYWDDYAYPVVEDGKVTKVIEVVRNVTDRIAVEEKYRTIFENSGDAIFVVGANQRTISEVNKTAEALTGYARSELVGMEPAKLFGSEFHGILEERYKNVLAKGSEKCEDLKLSKKTGELVHIEMSCSLVKYDSESSILILMRDITERKRAEEALQQSERRLHTIIESEPECVKLVSLDGTLLDMNPAGLAMIGAKSKEQACGKNIYNLILPEDLEKFRALHASASKGVSGTADFRIRTFDGVVRYMDSHAVPWRDEHGNIIAVLSVTRDVTEKKKAEEELKIEKEKLETVVKSTNAGLSLLDSSAKVVWANELLQEWFGNLEEIRGKYCYDLYGLKEPEKECAALKVLKSKSIERGEAFAKTIKGEERYFQLFVSPVKGDIKQMIELTIDVTEGKKAEKALEESEKKYRSLVDSALVGVYRTTLKGDVLYANKALLDMVEFDSVEEAAKEGALARYKNKKDREALIERLKKEGKVNNFEFEMLTKTGKIKNVLLSATLVGDTLSGMIRDMTEYKKAQEEVIESEKRFKHLFDAAPEGFAMLELPLLKIAECDVSFPQMVRRSKEEVLKMSLFEVIGEENREKLRKEMKKALEEGSNVVLFEFPVEGEKKVLRFSFVKVKYKERDVIAAIVSDVTKEKAAEKEIIEMKDFLSSVITNSGDAIVTTNLEGKVTSWNRGAEEIFGYSANEMIGSTVYDIYPLELRSRRKEFAEVLQRGERIKNEKVKIITKNRGTIWISLTMDLLKDKEGKPSGIVGISKDITKEIEAEEKLKKAYEELEKRTSEVEKVNKFLVGRELRMVELKNRIKELEETMKKVKL